MNVQKVIKEKGWTVTGVANEMGIKQISLSQILSRNPTVKTLRRIADIIGCKVGDFFRDELSHEASPSTITFICPNCGEHIPVDVKLDVKSEHGT